MRMQGKIAVNTILFIGSLQFFTASLAVSGDGERFTYATCMKELERQGVRDALTQCWPCRANPDLPICQGKGASSRGSSGGLDSMGRSGSTGFSGSSDGPDTSQMKKLGRNSTTGASYECVNEVGRVRGRHSSNVTIEYKNICGYTVILEDVCRNMGMRPIINDSDKWTVTANSSSNAVCE